ncbi:MAG: PilZ domain-containing protein [Hyphomicrobiaceae bacterium]
MKTMALARVKEKLATEESDPACNRRSRRKDTSLPAMLTFHNMRLTVPCTVADMSGSGAKLAFPATMQQQFGDMEHLPEKCVLVLKADRMQVDIQIMWRRTGHVGVRFLSPPKPLPNSRR